MLKITQETDPKSVKLTLEGRLAGPWVEELDHAWEDIRATRKDSLIVDLTGVTFIEPKGKALLGRMWRDGVELLAAGCCTRSIVEEITQGGGDSAGKPSAC